MTKFQKVVSKISFSLMMVLPICFLVAVLCSDYRTEDEYYQSQSIIKYCLNWYTLGVSLFGGLVFTTISLLRTNR